MGNQWRVIVATLLLVGCSGINVSQDYDPATAFPPTGNFSWVSETQDKTGDPRVDNPLRDTRIRAAIERVLTRKGYTLSGDGKQTFLIQYKYILRSRIDSNSSSPTVGFGVGSYGRHGGIAIGTSTGDQIREYDEGSLVIDFLAPQGEDLLWRGTGTQMFKQYDDPEKTTRDIDALVEKILEQFPP